MLERLRSLPIDAAPANDKLRERAVAVSGLVEAIASRPSDEREEILAAGALALDPGRERKGSAKAWGSESVRAKVHDAVEEFANELNNLLSRLRAAALATVMPRIIEFVRSDEHARGREGQLTFDDLILRTRRLLANNVGAVDSLRSRFQTLLIDEFQDTDPMRAHRHGFAADPETGLMEGRLFLVATQSSDLPLPPR